jgi:hypothetical protein
MIQALLLALFPGLRSEAGLRASRLIAQRLAPFWMDGRPFLSWTELMAAASAKQGPVTVVVDDTVASAIVEHGVHDCRGMTFRAARTTTEHAPA